MTFPLGARIISDSAMYTVKKVFILVVIAVLAGVWLYRVAYF